MRILGIDPGTIAVGYGLVEAGASRYRAVAYGVIRCRPADPPAERLARIFGELRAVLAQHHADVVAIEDGFVGRNPRSALRIGEGRGAAMVAAATAGLAVVPYAPASVKRAVTCSGRAGKASVAHMVALLLGLDRIPDSDAADALAVAICHGQRVASSPNGLQQAAG